MFKRGYGDSFGNAMQLHDYVAAVHSAISRQDGQTLAYLVQVSPRGSKGRVLVEGLGPGKVGVPYFPADN